MDLGKILRLEGFRQNIESYAKIRNLRKEELFILFEEVINELLRNKDLPYRIEYNLNKIIIKDENSDIYTGEIEIENPNQIVADIKKSLEDKIYNLRLDKCHRDFANKNENLIDIQIVRISNRFVIGEYEGVEVLINDFNLVRKDRLKVGDNLKILLEKILEDRNETRLEGTRRGVKFVVELLKQIVPEVNEERIELILVERLEGVKTYIVVSSNDPFISPIKTVVGLNSARINVIKQHLPERIEIVNYMSEPELFLRELFKKNLIGFERHKESFHLKLRKLNSNSYPSLELEILAKLFPRLKFEFELIDLEDEEI